MCRLLGKALQQGVGHIRAGWLLGFPVGTHSYHSSPCPGLRSEKPAWSSEPTETLVAFVVESTGKIEAYKNDRTKLLVAITEPL
jgi:hypothetical protein